MLGLSQLLLFVNLFATNASAQNQTCKTTPLEATWPSLVQWRALNTSIEGTLFKTDPVAAACFDQATVNTSACNVAVANWTLPAFHAALPESIDYPLYANNSCLPPGATGFIEGRGCSLGALPQYIVNATSEQHIATAMAWAATRNIRIVVKGTGHDMNGRSSGAFSMSIWTRNFRTIDFDSAWQIPGSNTTADVVLAGSGNDWGRMNTAAENAGKAMVGGEAASVGLGGYIQGGGHGPLSSHYGLAADQILQATVVTTDGRILRANPQENSDLLWAIRGGGAGQYGVVTEYVLKVYPAPTNVVVGVLSLSSNATNDLSMASAWSALAVDVSSIPDIMDAGISGQVVVSTQIVAGKAVPRIIHNFYGFNMTASAMNDILKPIAKKMQAQSNDGTLLVSLSAPTVFANYTSFFAHLNPPASTGVAGGASLMSSRLLGREHLDAAHMEQTQLVSFLQRSLTAQDPTRGASMIIGMQGGYGLAQVPAEMRGALHSSWRTAYIHMITLGATINATADAETTLSSAATFVNENCEKLWREWAPSMGSYMNEANPYNPEFKQDYYGESYARLLAIKRKYDPSESLFVLAGVGSDSWSYSLRTGKLCLV